MTNTGTKPKRGQSFFRITWKRSRYPDRLSLSLVQRIQYLHMDKRDLADVFFRIYLQLFPAEDFSALFLNQENIHNASLPQYYRGGFAAFLRLVKSRVIVDWNKLMNELLQRVGNDPRLILGRNYILELFLYRSPPQLSGPYDCIHLQDPNRAQILLC
jgi:hypothetical protein